MEFVDCLNVGGEHFYEMQMLSHLSLIAKLDTIHIFWKDLLVGDHGQQKQ